MVKKKGIVNIRRYKDKAKAEAAVHLLKQCGIHAAINTKELLKKERPVHTAKRTSVWVKDKDAGSASMILEAAARFAAQPDEILSLPPEEGTLEFLDMLIHDCRQYLMIAAGELKSIEEEGTLALDEPANDIEKITIRLKRLKDQCMRMVRKRPLDWQR